MGVCLGCKDQAALVHRFAPVVNVDVQSLNVVMICHADLVAVVQKFLVAAVDHAVVVQSLSVVALEHVVLALKFLAFVA